MDRFLTGCTALLLLAGTGVGQDSQKDDKVLDRDFLVKSASASHAEVKISENVENRTGNAKVKELARKMVKDHTALNEKLAKLSTEQKVAILVGMEKDTKDTLDRLSKLSGMDLDRAYVKTMVTDHEKAIQLFETQAKYGKDAKLVDLARSTLPELREHLREAQTLAAQLNAD